MDPGFADVALNWGTRLAVAAAILAAGVWFAYFLSRLIRREAIKHPHIDTTLGTFLALVARYGIVGIVLIAVLQNLGVQTASLLAVLGAGALAIGLALQGTLGNVASGIMIVITRPYHIGDFIEINGREGKVTDLDLFFTSIETLENRRIMVPHAQTVAGPITNFTTQGRRRCVITVGVGYEDDLDRALDVLKATMAADSRVIDQHPTWAGVDTLGDFAVSLSGRVWVRTDDYLDYRADMLKAVKEAFDREGIEMPYPHAVELSKGELPQRTPPIKPPRTT